MTPAELKYTKSHEWVSLDEATGIATVGITDFAAEQLGDIVFVELPAVGDSVAKDTPFGVIESVKAAVDVMAPISGQVIEINEATRQDYDIFKEDAYGRAWMIKVKPADAHELDSLLTAADYEAHIQESL